MGSLPPLANCSSPSQSLLLRGQILSQSPGCGPVPALIPSFLHLKSHWTLITTAPSTCHSMTATGGQHRD